MPSSSAAPFLPGHGRDFLPSATRMLLVVASVVFLAALAGIYSRPAGFLAAFWPANAILATFLLRAAPQMRLPVIAGALFGYQAAGYVFGDAPWEALQMTAANMVSAVSFTFVYQSLGDREPGLGRAQAVLALAIATLVASAAAGVAGGPVWAHLANVNYFDAWRTWFSSELMNYLVLMPGLLAVHWPLHWPGIARVKKLALSSAMLPVAAVAVTLFISVVAVHPIAIVFPVPALIWAALSLPLVVTCGLVVLFSGVTMFAVKLAMYDFGPEGLSDPLIASVHLGVAMIALAPVLVAASTAERRRQFAELERSAHFDGLTEALNRGAFLRQAQAMVQRQRRLGAPVAAVLIDVDYFKRINDLHGHASGDLALVAMSAVIRRSIRNGDIFGRLGGEEFALLLSDAEVEPVRVAAERIREQVQRLQTTLPDGTMLQMTVSIGVAVSHRATAELPEMLSLADRAMYEAKRAGRNQVFVRDLDAQYEDEEADHGGNGSVSGTQLQAGAGDHPG